ncbi:MAG: radical SAM protein, partial [Pseudomonadota bacterium]|nr:radical SAM protein [Pseudomonadota bacterium]
MLHDINTTPLALYVHWPYCLSKCPYCDFNSHVADSIDIDAFTRAYKKELDFYASVTPRRPLHSIFFGGGTPSLMPPKLVQDIIDYARDLFGLEQGCEITLEANPTSFETEKFKAFKDAGVNRVSLGVQSL